MLLGVIAVLLALAWVAQGWVLSFAATVLAMGVLNGVTHAVGGVPVGTMVTGTLVGLGENIADRLAGRPAPIGENAGQWVAFVAAAALGALACHPLGTGALAVPATTRAILAAVTAREPRLRTAGSHQRPSPPSQGYKQ